MSEKADRIGALYKGLETSGPNAVCAAVYLRNHLGDFPEITDDFSYDSRGGMDSETIRLGMPRAGVYEEAEWRDYEEFQDDVQAGRLLREYDLQDLSLYLYNKKEGVTPKGMKRKVKELQNRSDEMEVTLEELEDRLNT